MISAAVRAICVENDPRGQVADGDIFHDILISAASHAP